MSEVKKTAAPDAGAAKKTQANDRAGKETKKRKTETVAYLGPDIRGTVRHGEIFSGGISPALDGVMEKVPLLRGLCVPMEKAAGKFAELKTGGPARKLYDEAERMLKEKGEENGRV